MNSKKLRFAGIGLLITPFFVAGWFIASWISYSYPQDSAKVEILVVDPPSKFDLVAQDLGFGITNASKIKNMKRVAYHVRVPMGFTAESALQLLREEFPGVALDASYKRAR